MNGITFPLLWSGGNFLSFKGCCPVYMTAPSWFSLRRSVLSLTSLVERGKGLINRGIERESTQGNELSLAKHEVMRALKPLKKQMYDSVWQKR